jgi:hypothetical protein
MRTTGEVAQRGILCRLKLLLLGVVLLGPVIAPVVEAVPKRIIILRHGEKQDDYALCGVGQERSQALRYYYLGKGASSSLFPPGTGPDAIFALTLHSLELVSPTAQSWEAPLRVYSVVPLNNLSKAEETLQLNKRTQEAAHHILTDPSLDGKTVVMAWEHDHIAKKKLERQFPNERVTLRQLLHLDALPSVPENWNSNNFDYFWIAEYGDPDSDIPTKFTRKRQIFPTPYEDVPSNIWGKPEDLPDDSGCEQ